jgi:glutamate-1-semialdehyde 2,1-aminomutase
VERIQAHCDARGYPVHIPHIGSIFWMAFSREAPIRRADQIRTDSMDHFKNLHRELLDRGLYLGPSGYEVGFVSAAHSEADLAEAAALICDALDNLSL